MENIADATADVTEAAIAPKPDTAPADSAPPDAQKAVSAPLDTTSGTEPAAAPLETAQDQGSDTSKGTEIHTLTFDAEHLAAMAAEIKAHVDAGLAQVRADFNAEIDSMATHFEGRLDKLDLAALESLVKQANEAMARIAATPVTNLGERLTKLELQLKHFL